MNKVKNLRLRDTLLAASVSFELYKYEKLPEDVHLRLGLWVWEMQFAAKEHIRVLDYVVAKKIPEDKISECIVITDGFLNRWRVSSYNWM